MYTLITRNDDRKNLVTGNVQPITSVKI